MFIGQSIEFQSVCVKVYLNKKSFFPEKHILMTTKSIVQESAPGIKSFFPKKIVFLFVSRKDKNLD
jgi:hypothetical protein